MKLSAGLIVTLAGLSYAAGQSADVYQLHSQPSSSSNAPSIPRQVARLILLQRLAPNGRFSSNDIPDSITTEAAVSFINDYGRAPASLFAEPDASGPSQLAILLEGVTTSAANTLQATLAAIDPAFVVSDPPSSLANQRLLDDMYAAGVAEQRDCSFDKAINPFEEACWGSKSAIARYDVQKNPEVLSLLADNLDRLRQMAKSGEMETTLVVLPESSRSSKFDRWAPRPEELRRRQVEEVMADVDEPEMAPTTPATNQPPVFIGNVQRGSIPACFNSQNSCITATANCTGKGNCVDRWAKATDDSSANSCFACQCASIRASPNSGVTHWAGPTCSKIDVSAPFWLFVGFGVLIIGVLTFAIGMLFNVGEEKLPGVIGAGVSRAK